jgi:hypothetical protein
LVGSHVTGWVGAGWAGCGMAIWVPMLRSISIWKWNGTNHTR